MAGNWMILSPDGGSLPVSTEGFLAAAADRWGTSAQLFTETGSDRDVDATVMVPSPGEHGFAVRHFRTGELISTDGYFEQAAEVAAWIRSLLPEATDVPVWLVDAAYEGHVFLTPGISAEQVRQSWVEHGEDDPALS